MCAARYSSSQTTCFQGVSGFVRYMTHAHRRDVIEALLAIIAKAKVLRLVHLLRTRQFRMKRLISKLIDVNG